MKNLITTIFGLALAVGSSGVIKNESANKTILTVAAAGLGISAKDARNRN